MLVALIVVRFDYASVSAISILFGFVAIAAGLLESGVMAISQGWWKLLHGVLAVIFHRHRDRVVHPSGRHVRSARGGDQLLPRLRRDVRHHRGDLRSGARSRSAGCSRLASGLDDES